MPLLAYAVQERDKICATFAARDEQTQELLVNRHCSDVTKKK